MKKYKLNILWGEFDYIYWAYENCGCLAILKHKITYHYGIASTDGFGYSNQAEWCRVGHHEHYFKYQI